MINNKLGTNNDKEKGFMYYGQDVVFETLRKIIKQKPQKISKNLKYKIIKNNNLYVKNYKKDFTKQICNQIIHYLKKIKVKSKDNFVSQKILLKIIIILKKSLTLNF